MRPRLLDLFCNAGGAAMGYHRAGFDVVGVDVEPQPNYPFDFVQDDAIALMTSWTNSINGWWDEPPFHAIHASPPCQRYSSLVTMRTDKWGVENGSSHPDLVEITRKLLQATGLPYVIENVPGSPLINPVILCGSAVGLPVVECADKPRQVRRHRLFETNWTLLVPPCDHRYPALGVYGGGRWKRDAEDNRRGGYQGSAEERQLGMGIDWASRDEIAQAIPPAYTELIGAQLLGVVEKGETDEHHPLGRRRRGDPART